MFEEILWKRNTVIWEVRGNQEMSQIRRGIEPSRIAEYNVHNVSPQYIAYSGQGDYHLVERQQLLNLLNEIRSCPGFNLLKIL